MSVASAATQAIKNMKTNVQHVPGSSAVGGLKSTLQSWRPGHRKAKTTDNYDTQTDDGFDEEEPDLRIALGSNASLRDDSADRLSPDVIFNQILVKIFSSMMREQNVMTDVFNFTEVDVSALANCRAWQEILFVKREPPVDVKIESKVK
jgi:hypothetical protein